MSATTQALMEQLEELKITISLKEMKGEDASELRKLFLDLQEKLLASTRALNEGKQILKG